MASSDWSFLATGGSITALETSVTTATSSGNGNCRVGVTTGLGSPNGGGDFVLTMKSLTTATGLVALYANPSGQAGYAPVAAGKGMSVRGVMKRHNSKTINYAPFFFFGWQATNLGSAGYVLGLSDSEPSHLVLRKIQGSNTLATGIPDAAAGTSGVLARSTETYTNNTYVDVRVDLTVNASGDSLIQVFTNDLDDFTVTSPTWVQVTSLAPHTAGGEDVYNDDVAGVNSGSAPYNGGYGGIAGWFKDSGCVIVMDHIEFYKQN